MDIALRNTVKKQLLWVAMAAISMFFASLLSAFIVEKADVGNWHEFILPNYFVLSTGIIIISSLVLLFVKQKLRKEKSVFSLVFAVLILGTLFSYFQIKGWQQLTNQGIYLTGAGSNISGSFLYVVTLTHLLHLLGGLIALLISTIKSKRNLYSIDNYLGLELTSIYWHFLTVLWITLFCFLKFY
jgi:cytochrome c oxidase subunit 3